MDADAVPDSSDRRSSAPVSAAGRGSGRGHAIGHRSSAPAITASGATGAKPFAAPATEHDQQATTKDGDETEEPDEKNRELDTAQQMEIPDIPVLPVPKPKKSIVRSKRITTI